MPWSDRVYGTFPKGQLERGGDLTEGTRGAQLAVDLAGWWSWEHSHKDTRQSQRLTNL